MFRRWPRNSVFFFFSPAACRHKKKSCRSRCHLMVQSCPSLSVCVCLSLLSPQVATVKKWSHVSVCVWAKEKIWAEKRVPSLSLFLYLRCIAFRILFLGGGQRDLVDRFSFLLWCSWKETQIRICLIDFSFANALFTKYNHVFFEEKNISLSRLELVFLCNKYAHVWVCILWRTNPLSAFSLPRSQWDAFECQECDFLLRGRKKERHSAFMSSVNRTRPENSSFLRSHLALISCYAENFDWCWLHEPHWQKRELSDATLVSISEEKNNDDQLYIDSRSVH